MTICVHHLLSLWSLLLTLPISVWSCTDDVSCTFGLVNGECGWNSLSEKKFQNNYELGNAYMSVDMGSDAQANVTALYSSPRICATRDTHTFTLRYSLQYGDNCHMTSYVSRSDGTNISLWDTSVFVKSRPYSQLPPSLVCPQGTEFQIIIQITKIGRGGCGEVRIDDVEYKSSTSDKTTCTVTPATSAPGVQGKTSPVVQSTDTLPSLNSDLVTTDIVTVSSLSSETSQTGTTLSSNSTKSSTDLRETEKVQRGSAAPQDKKMSAGLGAGIGLTVCILFIVSASVTVIVVRKKCKTSEKRTVMNTATSFHEPADNEKPRNAQETFATDGDMTVHTESPVHQRTTCDDRVTSFDHVITEAGSCPDCSQENYGILFSKVSDEQATQLIELDTYSHVKAQNATGDVSDDNKTLRISELGQSNMSADSKAGAPQDTDEDYVELRTSITSRGIASGSDVYDHLKGDMYVNVASKAQL